MLLHRANYVPISEACRYLRAYGWVSLPLISLLALIPVVIQLLTSDQLQSETRTSLKIERMNVSMSILVLIECPQ
jgi:hypothetical protein